VNASSRVERSAVSEACLLKLASRAMEGKCLSRRHRACMRVRVCAFRGGSLLACVLRHV